MVAFQILYGISLIFNHFLSVDHFSINDHIADRLQDQFLTDSCALRLKRLREHRQNGTDSGLVTSLGH